NCAASHSKTCAHHHHRGGHKHRHQAANCAKRSVEPNSPDRAHEQDSPPAQRVPLTHTDCAACQFLAQHSIPVAPVTLDAVEAIVPLATPGWPAHPPISVAKCHPARGPPCRG
ncbi:MAG: hypothetical protein ACKV0T_12300, partial [Planctomycetales bacterium]